MKLNYRPEIDGLRAIAVLSVVFYHAKFSFFEKGLFVGGFLGVDIFFVISGYLITKLILIELNTTGNFSFSKFYERRARRILPALFVVMFFSIVAGYIILLPHPFSDFSKSILYQLGFISNFYFWSYYHFGYMTENALMLPFLHTWSLSVEEQFYLIFPIFLFLIFNFYRKGLNAIIIIGILISLMLSHYSSTKYESLTFYMLPFRGWELLAGALLASSEIFLDKKKFSFKNKLYEKILTLLSLSIILLYIFFFDSRLPHPSFYTSFLIVAVCIIIWFSNEDDIVTRLLSQKLLVGVGLISYSLYLWHYPIFSFARHLEGPNFENNTILKILIILSSIILSAITFLFIEKKFRNSNLKFKKFSVYLITCLGILLIPCWLIIKNIGYESRLNLSKFQKNFINVDVYAVEQLDTIKNLKNEESKKKILVIGNSHGLDFFKMLSSNKNFTDMYNIKFFFVQTHCIEEIMSTGKNLCTRTFNRDKKKLNEGIQRLKNSDILILKTRWYKSSLEKVESTISFLKKYNKEIILVSDFSVFAQPSKDIESKKFNKNPPQRILFRESFLLERFILENDRFPNKKELKNIEKKYFELLKKEIIENNKSLEKKAKELDIRYLDHLSLICNEAKKMCEVSTDDEKVIHTDNAGHISTDGAKYIGKKMYKTNWLNIE